MCVKHLGGKMKGFGIIKPLEQVGWIEKDAPVAGPYEAVLDLLRLSPVPLTSTPLRKTQMLPSEGYLGMKVSAGSFP